MGGGCASSAALEAAPRRAPLLVRRVVDGFAETARRVPARASPAAAHAAADAAASASLSRVALAIPRRPAPAPAAAAAAAVLAAA